MVNYLHRLSCFYLCRLCRTEGWTDREEAEKEILGQGALKCQNGEAWLWVTPNPRTLEQTACCYFVILSLHRNQSYILCPLPSLCSELEEGRTGSSVRNAWLGGLGKRSSTPLHWQPLFLICSFLGLLTPELEVSLKFVGMLALSILCILSHIFWIQLCQQLPSAQSSTFFKRRNLLSFDCWFPYHYLLLLRDFYSFISSLSL